jgi:simple sugar transport system ATP-binding protein
LVKQKGGTIKLNGHDISNVTIRERNVSGLSHIPEDRHKHGLVLEFDLAENLALQTYFEKDMQNKGFIKFDARTKRANQLIDQYDIRAGRRAKTNARSMSGGNQQKAIIAREFERNPSCIVAVQPTRGLDVGAIEYIHRQLIKARDDGKAVLLISLELNEVLEVSDRIIVMYEGEVVGELNPKQTTQQELGLYMSGSKKDKEVKHV